MRNIPLIAVFKDSFTQGTFTQSQIRSLNITTVGINVDKFTGSNVINDLKVCNLALPKNVTLLTKYK